MINSESYPVNRAPTKSIMADSNVVEADDNGGGSGSHHLFSNGFKLTDSGGGYNGDGATYVYMAFAETPFKTANAR